MSAVIKLEPLTARAIKRPSYRNYDLIQRNRRDAWIMSNMDLLLRYYRETEEGLRASGHWIAPIDPQAEFTVFCDIQFESEHAKYEEMKADGFDDPYAREDA